MLRILSPFSFSRKNTLIDSMWPMVRTYSERHTRTETVHSPENPLYFTVQMLDF